MLNRMQHPKVKIKVVLALLDYAEDRVEYLH
jgi:hypothetical protein